MIIFFYMPKVSIIVPVYNVEQYLNRCVESLVRQTFTDIEIILVDDGSPDNSPQLCDILAKKYQMVRVIHKVNGGLSSARLAGYKEAKGKYCIFIDSDDYIDDDMIETLYIACSNNDADMSMCSWYTNTADGRIIQNKLQTQQTIIESKDMLLQYFLPHLSYSPIPGEINLTAFLWLRFIKKSVLSEDVFVSEREYITEDILMQQMLAFKLNKVVIVNEPKYHYCFNGTSLTNKFRDGAFEKMMARYHFSKDLCRKHNLLDIANVRLQFNLLSAVGFSVLNACKLPKYSDAKKEMKIIFNHPEVQEMYSTIDRSYFSLQQKVMYLGYKLDALYPLYKYLRWRMHV